MKIAKILFCLLLYAFPGFAAFAFNNNDVQFWNTDSVEMKIGSRAKIKVEEEFRIGDNISEFYYFHTDGGISYNLADWLELGANYRLITEKKVNTGTWKTAPT